MATSMWLPNVTHGIYRNTAWFRLYGVSEICRQRQQLTNSRQIHTTSARHAILLGPLAKQAAIVGARIAKYWWKKLPHHKKQNYKQKFKQHQNRLYIFAGLGTCFGLYYCYSHIDRVPLTGRTRLMMLSSEHLKEIGEMMYEEQVKLKEGQFLSDRSHSYERVERVVTRLIAANRDIKELGNLHWVINVIKSDEVNAYVLPDGQIFVNTGMLSMLPNDDTLAFLLGHEMAHAILSHAAEQMSLLNIFDLIAAVTLGFVWALMPTDAIAIVTHWFHNTIASICLHRPYSRKLEEEADRVGSDLATKACYDVNAATKFWEMLAIKDPSNAELEWLSTHPSHEKRANLIKDRSTELNEIWRLYECHKHHQPTIGNYYKSSGRLGTKDRSYALLNDDVSTSPPLAPHQSD